MTHRKLAGPMRVQSAGATTLNYALDPSPGGHLCKVILWSIKVIQASPNVRLGLKFATGPDGDTFTPNRTAIGDVQPPPPPSTLEGASGTPDTDSSDVLNEWIRASIDCGVESGTADEWAIIEVFETRKPF